MPWYNLFSVEDTQLNVRTAQEAIARSDLQHAFFHISSALATDPLNREYRAILDTVIQRAPNAEVFARSNQAKLDFITVAGRAYIHGAKHEFDKAIPLLSQVVASRPDVPFLLWAREWVQMHPSAVLLDPAALDGVLKETIRWVGHVPVPVAPDDPRRANLEAAADLLAAFRQPFAQNSFLLFASAVVLRRLGRFDEAIALAHQAFTLQGDWNTAIGVACAFRDARRVDEAVGWWRHAMTYDPKDVSPLLDIGDTYLTAQRFDEAIAVYQETMAREPNHPWATASLVYARFKKTGDPAEKQRLRAMTDSNERAEELFEILEPKRLYVNSLPAPSDATAKALTNIVQMVTDDPAKAQGGKVALKVTHPESPSVLHAFEMWKAANRFDIGVALTIDKVQHPDPRAAKGHADFVLWTYDGTAARPNVPPPDPRAASAIADIAKMPFDLVAWDAPARDLGMRMGAPWIPQVVSCMVHVSPIPAEMRPRMNPFEWVRRVQIAAALVVANMGTEPWDVSARKRALTSLAIGPTDWSTDAAIIVIAWMAQKDPAVRHEAMQLFPFLASQIPKDGYTCFEHPLLTCWLGLGGLDPVTQRRLVARKEAIERGDSDDAESAPEEERRAGITLGQYAELSVRRDALLMQHGGGGNAANALTVLCREFKVDESRANVAIGRVPEWDQIINQHTGAQEEFMRLSNAARMKIGGIDPSSNEGRAAEMIRQGQFDVEGAKQNAMAAAAQAAQGDDGDPDPLVFPGQKIARLSQYVGLMKGMQAGDMNGALARAGVDMGGYAQAAQAWGLKFATDPVLSAKFSKMMA